MNTNNGMMMASKSNSITLGVGSFTTCPFSRTRTCCIHVLASPNAKSRGAFSLSLSLTKRRSLCILSSPTETALRHLNTPVSALNSGLEASITDSNDISAILTNAKIVVDSEDENKTQLRVDLTGDQTQKVFDRILTNLGRTAPPVPGFRMQKGGKSSKIPKDFLVQMLGEERVTKFAIQEILNSTMADYAKKASDFYHFICSFHGYTLISTCDDPIPGKLGCKGPEDKHYPNGRTTEKIIHARK
ncbi:Trigger factor [Spatholobus suberectus]|nr:Trigger factor [Spatholobus suberectus]